MIFKIGKFKIRKAIAFKNDEQKTAQASVGQCRFYKSKLCARFVISCLASIVTGARFSLKCAEM